MTSTVKMVTDRICMAVVRRTSTSCSAGTTRARISTPTSWCSRGRLAKSAPHHPCARCGRAAILHRLCELHRDTVLASCTFVIVPTAQPCGLMELTAVSYLLLYAVTLPSLSSLPNLPPPVDDVSRHGGPRTHHRAAAAQAESEGHDDEGRSRGSSASSSPRYPAAMLSHLVASMACSDRNAGAAAAAGTRGMPRLDNGGVAGHQHGGHQQPVYGFGAHLQHGRMPYVSSPQEGPRSNVGGPPAYMHAQHVAQGYGAQRPTAVAPEGYAAGWSQQGAFKGFPSNA